MKTMWMEVVCDKCGAHIYVEPPEFANLENSRTWHDAATALGWTEEVEEQGGHWAHTSSGYEYFSPDLIFVHDYCPECSGDIK